MSHDENDTSDADQQVAQKKGGCASAATTELNRTCFCITLDRAVLGAALRHDADDPEFFAKHIETRPHLFSHAPVFLPESDGQAMRAVVAGIEAVTALDGYREASAAWAPNIARADFGPRGAFMGYDFHLGDDGPKLIEINTNAGGAFLNAFLARAQIACCAEVEQALARAALDTFDDAVIAMFEAEWRLQGRAGRLARIAIVDDAPTGQYLYPEFVLAQRLFARRGIDAVIADPGALSYEGGRLSAAGNPIDLVYNRLVDFALEEPLHAALRAAYEDGTVVVTPNPHNHALFADKRNLTLLCDQTTLRGWGLPETHLRALAGLPRTIRVTSDNAPSLWQGRKHLFFKPVSGHGGKAVYRGDKLTKGVWDTILVSDYVAQDFARPSERTIVLDGVQMQRKLDVRLYTYAGSVLLAAARLYQGQTTNFRTPGGGFAPVFFI
jgi:hypothetical protein